MSNIKNMQYVYTPQSGSHITTGDSKKNNLQSVDPHSSKDRQKTPCMFESYPGEKNISVK